MRIKLLVESVLIGIFVLAIIALLSVLVNTNAIVFLDGLLLMMLYLIFSFWLFKDPDISVIYIVLIGMVYSLTIFTCIYCSFSLFGNLFFVIICYTFLLINTLNSLFQYKKNFYRRQFYRSLFFLALLSFIYINHY